MQPLFTSEGTKHFQPTPDVFLDGLNVEYSAEGSNRKNAEIDVYKHFCDFVQDQGMEEGTRQFKSEFKVTWWVEKEYMSCQSTSDLKEF